jgi:hypothetical protein
MNLYRERKRRVEKVKAGQKVRLKKREKGKEG